MATVSPLTDITSGAAGLFNDSGSLGSLVNNFQQLQNGVQNIANPMAYGGGSVPTSSSGGAGSNRSVVAGLTKLAGNMSGQGTSTTAAPTITATPMPAPVSSTPTASAPNTGVSGLVPSSTPITPGLAPTNPGTSSATNSEVNNIYGTGVGTTVTNLLNTETPGTASSDAQAIINANQPNVQQGSDQLNTALAAAGISPSSSVSALENANYQAGVQQQNLSTEAQTNLTEQQMQQQLIESLMPSAQKYQTDNSGWSIFGDIMSGLGDIF